MSALIILAIVLLNCSKATIQSSFSRKYVRSNNEGVLFTGIFFFTLSAFLALISPIQMPGKTGMLLILSGAILNAVYQFTYLISFNSGPVSLTSIFVNLNLFIPVVFGIAVYKENITIYHIIGIILLVTSLVLGVNKVENGKGVSGRWLFLTLSSMLSAGLSVVVQRVYRENIVSANGAESNTYLVLAYFIASIILFAVYFITRKREKTEVKRFNPAFLYYGMATGIVLGIYQKFFMYALGEIDSVFLLPIQSGLVSVTMSLVGIILFKDKLSIKQKIGICVGILCVIVMNLK